MGKLHVQFLAILPTIERHADVVYEDLGNFHDREDAVAETVVLAWACYYELARRMKHTFISPTEVTLAAVRSFSATGRPFSPRRR